MHLILYECFFKLVKLNGEESMFDHPIHSIFVHFPAGLIPTSVIFFILFLYTRKQIFELISILLLTMSLVFNLVAIGTGIYDWQIRYNGYFIQPIAIKFFLSLILFLLGIFIYSYRKIKIKQKGYGSLLRNIFYIFIFFLNVPFVLTIGYFGGELVHHSSVGYVEYNLNQGSKLFYLRCNSCHPNGQGIKSQFQFPGKNNEDYGSPALLNSGLINNKEIFIPYLRNPKRMPAFDNKTLSDENLGYILDYIQYLKTGIFRIKVDSTEFRKADSIRTGEKIFTENCSNCHPNGENIVKGYEKYKIIGSENISNGLENFKIFLRTVNTRLKNSKMPVFTDEDVSENDIKYLQKYLLQLK